MTEHSRWRGLRALLGDAVEHGSKAVERVHMQTARRPFVILESIPVIAAPTRVVHAIHDLSVTGTYGMIRLVNRAVGVALDAAIDVAEHRDGPIDPER